MFLTVLRLCERRFVPVSAIKQMMTGSELCCPFRYPRICASVIVIWSCRICLILSVSVLRTVTLSAFRINSSQFLRSCTGAYLRISLSRQIIILWKTSAVQANPSLKMQENARRSAILQRRSQGGSSETCQQTV